MNTKSCYVEGELVIETPDGPIRCVGTGDAFEVVFQNLRQLIRISRPVRSGPAGLIANQLAAAACHADVKVKLQIGERIVGEIQSAWGQDRPHVKLRFIQLVAAAVSKSP